MAITTLTDDTFESELQSHQGLALVDFWAPWCGPCQMILPILEEMSKELSEDVRIFKVNIDDSPASPTKYGVRSIPALMLFKDGQLIDTKVGVLPKSSLVSWIESHK